MMVGCNEVDPDNVSLCLSSAAVQKFSLVMGRSLPVSDVELLMRLRLRFIFDRSLSKTSPERKADTRSSNSPPSSSPFSLAFLAFRSFSLCSLSCKTMKNVRIINDFNYDESSFKFTWCTGEI